MDTITTGYAQKDFGQPVKRYCQTLDLVNDPEKIAKYKALHSKELHWKEIRDGIKAVGILEKEIYILDNRLFMIVETPLDFDWDSGEIKTNGRPMLQFYKDIFMVGEL